jgi:hypothetical protein
LADSPTRAIAATPATKRNFLMVITPLPEGNEKRAQIVSRPVFISRFQCVLPAPFLSPLLGQRWRLSRRELESGAQASLCGTIGARGGDPDAGLGPFARIVQEVPDHLLEILLLALKFEAGIGADG